MNPYGWLRNDEEDDDGEGCPASETAGRGESYVGSRLLKKRTLFLTGEISQRSADRLKAQLILLDEMDAEKPIMLFINSPGGDADAGYSIMDTMRFISAPITVICAGLTASAAVMVLLGAEKGKRLAFPNAHILIHQPSTSLSGYATDIQIEASEIVKMRERINELISEETGQPVEKVAGDTRRNFWMSAVEGVEYGLIDKVVNSRDDLK